MRVSRVIGIQAIALASRLYGSTVIESSRSHRDHANCEKRRCVAICTSSRARVEVAPFFLPPWTFQGTRRAGVAQCRVGEEATEVAFARHVYLWRGMPSHTRPSSPHRWEQTLRPAQSAWPSAVFARWLAGAAGLRKGRMGPRITNVLGTARGAKKVWALRERPSAPDSGTRPTSNLRARQTLRCLVEAKKKAQHAKPCNYGPELGVRDASATMQGRQIRWAS